MNLSCIVCAIDGADTSPIVLASAMALAEWERAELQIVHLAETASEGTLPSPVIRERSTVVVRGGDPATAVIEHARTVRADLIVVGTALTAPGIDRLGWLAEVIARDAHCPTLIVPLVTIHRREGLPFRNVLCPVDFSPGSVVAYERALTLAQRAGGSLTLLHVVDDCRDRKADRSFLTPDERWRRMTEANTRLGLPLSEHSPRWYHVGVHVSAGAADVHILAAARRLGADLIVMGLTPSMTTVPPRAASLVSRVATQAACPVLVIRATHGSPGWDEAYDAPHGAGPTTVGRGSSDLRLDPGAPVRRTFSTDHSTTARGWHVRMDHPFSR
jgi:nucleotide-binding universal stress UspA family protein